MNPNDFKPRKTHLKKRGPIKTNHLYAIDELELKIKETDTSFNKSKEKKEECEKQIAYFEEKIKSRKDIIYEAELDMNICESKSKSLTKSLDLLKSQKYSS